MQTATIAFDRFNALADQDAGERIRAADAVKPVWAVASDTAFSAAYAIGCSASRLLVSRTGGVGSIGVIAMHVDQSVRDAQEGYRFTAINKRTTRAQRMAALQKDGASFGEAFQAAFGTDAPIVLNEVKAAQVMHEVQNPQKPGGADSEGGETDSGAAEFEAGMQQAVAAAGLQPKGRRGRKSVGAVE